jgi:transposase
VVIVGRKRNFSEDEKSEIRKAYKVSHERRERTRLLAMKLVICKGYTTDHAAMITELSQTYIERLISLYHVHGLRSILHKKQGGNNRYLTFEQEVEILEKFKERAMNGQMITGVEIQRAYEAVVGHEVSNSQIYYVLKRHDWRKVRPRKQHPKADPVEQEAYKKNL